MRVCQDGQSRDLNSTKRKRRTAQRSDTSRTKMGVTEECAYQESGNEDAEHVLVRRCDTCICVKAT